MRRERQPVLYQDYFSRQLNVDSLIAANPDDEDMLREMLELVVENLSMHFHYGNLFAILKINCTVK